MIVHRVPTVVVPGGTLEPKSGCRPLWRRSRSSPSRFPALQDARPRRAWSGLRVRRAGRTAAPRRRPGRAVDSRSRARCTGFRATGSSPRPRAKPDAAPCRLPPHLHDDLEEHLRALRRPITGRLGIRHPSGYPLALVQLVLNLFARTSARAGRPDLRFHDLRQTGATLAAQAGGTHERTRRTRMGHGSARSRTTQGIHRRRRF